MFYFTETTKEESVTDQGWVRFSKFVCYFYNIAVISVI